jgi:DNA-binding HxlR family transcriptional regulator
LKKIRRLSKTEPAQPYETLMYAKQYLQEGLSIFPGPTYTKRATIKWGHYREEPLTEEEAEEEFKREANIIVICGTQKIINGKPYYLLVVDFDDKKLYERYPEKLKDTRTTLTGKGIHCWYYTSRPTPTHHLTEMGIPLDIQGKGAYIVAPPSWHNEKKKRYSWMPGKPMKIMKIDLDMEQYLFDWLEANQLVPSKMEKEWNKRLTIHDIDNLLKGVEKGGRDSAAIKVASWFRQGGLSREEALKKLALWDLKNKGPLQFDPDEPDNVLEVKVNSAYDNEYNYRFTREMTPLDKEGVVELTPEMEKFLKSPDLNDKILSILDTVIVGELSLKALHFYVGIGPSFLKTPFGVIIVDVFGAGKSYSQRNMAEIFPSSRVEQPTSMTMKVVNYLAQNFKGRILRIDELFGEEEGMPYIRVWMTEGRLEHWVTDKDTHEAKKLISEGCPCFFTSTTTTVEEQYGSRNWIACIDTSKEQTLHIHHFDYKHDALPKNFFSEDAERKKFLQQIIMWLMQNAKPVLIPFQYSFPLIPRARRDRQQFKQLIMCIANVYQLQRQKKTFGEQEYIIAQIEDFNLALKIAEPFLYQTMKTLDKYGLAILKWAQKYEGDSFSVSEFWKDYKDKDSISYRTLFSRFKQLQEFGYIESVEDELPGKKTYFQLTEMGKANIESIIEITNDGKWLLELYDNLDKKETKLETLKRFRELLGEAEEKFLTPPKSLQAFKVKKEKIKVKDDI